MILDLDNTIWGGIIGDDGLEKYPNRTVLGIGKSFSEFQEWIKRSRTENGISLYASKIPGKLLVISFEKHPDMILKLNDISVFKTNWNNK